MDLIEVKNKKNENRHPWEFARFEILTFFLKDVFKGKPNPTILDVGCGDTFVIDSLNKLFPKARYLAVDTAFTDELISFYKSKNNNIELFKNLDLIPTDLDVDCVLLMDVLEHINDDKTFLSSLVYKKFIGTGTKFVITVPAYQNLFCSHDVFLGHFRRYTNKSLSNLVKGAGLKTEQVGYFFFSLILPRLLQVIYEKIKPSAKNSSGLVDWDRGKNVTKFVKTCLITDFKFTFILNKIGIKLPGLSNYLICNK